MKKIISIIMAALMITSTAVVGTATASAKETTKTTYEYGDCNNCNRAKLALKQVGNTGSKYWNHTKAWKGGPTEWGSIFCAWLLENTKSDDFVLTPSKLGWSASVSQWKKNAIKKGCYYKGSKNTNLYCIGGFVLFNYGNCGVVVGETKTTITVVMGNSGNYNKAGYKKSTVTKQTFKRTDSSISGYIWYCEEGFC